MKSEYGGLWTYSWPDGVDVRGRCPVEVYVPRAGGSGRGESFCSLVGEAPDHAAIGEGATGDGSDHDLALISARILFQFLFLLPIFLSFFLSTFLSFFFYYYYFLPCPVPEMQDLDAHQDTTGLVDI